jgi:isochorismate synthase
MESVGIELGASRSVIREFAATTLADLAGRDIIGVMTLPAPRAPLSAFLSVVPRDMSFVWHNPPSGVDCAGGGVAYRIDVAGSERLAQLREQSEALWARVHGVQHPAAPDFAPRLFGGLAFSENNSQQSPWTAFGDGAFTLARWTYGHIGQEAFLSLAVCCSEAAAGWDEEILSELDVILEVLFEHEGCPTPMPPIPSVDMSAVSFRQFSPADWEVYIGQIHHAIEHEGYLKIVAARRCDVTLPYASNDVDVINRLTTEPKCATYAFRRAESSFVGASPELLFLKSGLELRTQALAGTARSSGRNGRSRTLQPADLLGSPKDRSEHEFVVEAIRNALAPLCDDVSVQRDPEVLKLRNILHINTPFEARVRPTTHATDLIAALHPTPAVGGVPRRESQEWIVAHEKNERGWYTGPVGWFDSRGDAEFAVAIRCGVIAGNHAHLYTGAGVVLNSNHASEYAETALKQLPMLRALGVERR